jgi:hypothetical protein
VGSEAFGSVTVSSSRNYSHYFGSPEPTGPEHRRNIEIGRTYPLVAEGGARFWNSDTLPPGDQIAARHRSRFVQTYLPNPMGIQPAYTKSFPFGYLPRVADCFFGYLRRSDDACNEAV